jgi:hypothetical protein
MTKFKGKGWRRRRRRRGAVSSLFIFLLDTLTFKWYYFSTYL